MSPPIGRAESQVGGVGPPGKPFYMNSYLLFNENYSDNINICKLKYFKTEKEEN
jgi:hypothetical protein